MGKFVVDVHSITAAHGWVYTDYGLEEPVMCLALVTVIDNGMSFIEPQKMVIAIGRDDAELIGMEISERHTNAKPG